MLLKLAYSMGCLHALQKIGMEPTEQDRAIAGSEGGVEGESEGEPMPEVAPEPMPENPEAELEALTGGDGMVDTADDFVQFVQSDELPEGLGEVPPEESEEDRPTHWGSGASLEGGDVGSRAHQMGLPQSGAV